MNLERDMDFIRDLLLRIEGGETNFETVSSEEAIAYLGYTPEQPMSRQEADKLRYHLDMLISAGFLEGGVRSGAGLYGIDAITWNGHEFLDSVRSPEVWIKTKETAKKAGAGTIDLVWGIAKEIAKAEVKRHTGLDL